MSLLPKLDLIAENKDFVTKGAPLGEGKGKLYVITHQEWPEEMNRAFIEKKPDHIILACAISIAKKFPKQQTILVTKDINLRMKARAMGCIAEDYISDKVENTDVFEKEYETFNNVDADLIDRLYSEKQGITADDFNFKDDITANECFVMKSSRASILARHVAESNIIRRVNKTRCFGIEPRNAEQTFAMDLLTDKHIQLIAITGKAGTGKTLLALAAALSQNEDYEQIMLARPIVAMSNKDLGALPGDAKEKVAPYMQPLFDNLNVIKHALGYQGKEVQIIDNLQKNNQLIIEALAYIRGRSLSNTYFIVDEAQNLTPHEIKTIITRAGEGTKIVFTGDIHQIDQPYLDMQSNGLVYMIDKMKGEDIFAHINLIKGERSYLSELASNLL